MGHGQEMTFSLIDQTIRNSTVGIDRYLGFFLLQYDNSNLNIANFELNRTPITREEAFEFIRTPFVPKKIKPLWA